MKRNLLTVICILLLIAFVFNDNSNAQWVSAGTVSNVGSYPSISVASPTCVFVAGGPNGTPVIWRTTNGGLNWVSIGTTGVSLEVYCVWAKDSLVVFVGDGGASGGAGGNAKVYKTTNGGVNWTTILQTGGTAGFINGIVFSKNNPMYGIIESDPPTGTTYWIAKTVDGGNNWFIQNPPLSGAASAQNSIVIIDTMFYGFGLNAAPSRVGVTTNAGVNWTYQTLVGPTGGFICAFAFADDKLNGLAASSGTTNAISRTTNGGLTWVSQTIPSGVTSGYVSIKFINGTSTAYLINSSASATITAKSTDFGATWTTIAPVSGVNGITHMEYVRVGQTVYLYAISSTGAVMKLVDNVLVGVENNNSIPEEYKLEQNYPNPFNPTTTINFSLPKSAFVTIKVYDILGKEIKTILSENKDSGNHSVLFDAGDLPSGIYYYKIIANNFIDTKKMILLK